MIYRTLHLACTLILTLPITTLTADGITVKNDIATSHDLADYINKGTRSIFGKDATTHNINNLIATLNKECYKPGEADREARCSEMRTQLLAIQDSYILSRKIVQEAQYEVPGIPIVHFPITLHYVHTTILNYIGSNSHDQHQLNNLKIFHAQLSNYLEHNKKSNKNK